MKKIIIIVLILNILTFAAHAETERIRIIGTVGSSSARGLEESFSRLQPVEKVKVDLNKMLITIKIKDGQKLLLEDAKKAVADNGLILSGVLVTGNWDDESKTPP